jgi:hypothetical protein
MQAVFHSRVDFQVVLPFSLPFLHACRDIPLLIRPGSVFRMLCLRLVLSVDKTEVGQSLRWHPDAQLACHGFFFADKKCSHGAGFVVSRVARCRSRDGFPSLVNLDRKKGW